jgi:hypothetical protein
MKQTAVEWLVSELTEVDRNLINKTFLQLDNSLSGHRLKDIFKQAKEMEKQQIIDAWIVADNELQRTKAEKYYNITYKQD